MFFDEGYLFVNKDKKEKFYGVLDLDITYSYIKSLLYFVNEFPEAESMLIAAGEAKDGELYMKFFNKICMMLEKIHADELSEKYHEYAIILETSQPDKADPYMENLLSRTASLSFASFGKYGAGERRPFQ